MILYFSFFSSPILPIVCWLFSSFALLSLAFVLFLLNASNLSFFLFQQFLLYLYFASFIRKLNISLPFLLLFMYDFQTILFIYFALAAFYKYQYRELSLLCKYLCFIIMSLLQIFRSMFFLCCTCGLCLYLFKCTAFLRKT